MTRAIIIIVLLGCLAPAWAAEPEPSALKPISAAEAERRVGETRDALTDLLWMGIEPYWHKGDFDNCLRLTRQTVEVDPHFVEAGTSLAWLLWSVGRDDEAIAAYEKCIAANPKSWKAHHEFGLFYMARNKYLKAAEQFRAAKDLGAPIPHIHMLPNALEKAGRLDEALDEWHDILRRFPDDAVAKRRAERLERELSKERSKPKSAT